MTRHGPVQTWIIDDTAFAKSGPQSVGVQRQYCGALGKVANCQVVVSLTAATAHSHMPLDMQLYLPQSWLQSASLRRLARIPEAAQFQWLILERRDGTVREVRAHLSSLPDWIGRRRLVYLLKERFRTEMRHP